MRDMRIEHGYLFGIRCEEIKEIHLPDGWVTDFSSLQTFAFTRGGAAHYEFDQWHPTEPDVMVRTTGLVEHILAVRSEAQQ